MGGLLKAGMERIKPVLERLELFPRELITGMKPITPEGEPKSFYDLDAFVQGKTHVVLSLKDGSVVRVSVHSYLKALALFGSYELLLRLSRGTFTNDDCYLISDWVLDQCQEKYDESYSIEYLGPGMREYILDVFSPIIQASCSSKFSWVKLKTAPNPSDVDILITSDDPAKEWMNGNLRCTYIDYDDKEYHLHIDDFLRAVFYHVDTDLMTRIVNGTFNMEDADRITQLTVYNEVRHIYD